MINQFLSNYENVFFKFQILKSKPQINLYSLFISQSINHQSINQSLINQLNNQSVNQAIKELFSSIMSSSTQLSSSILSKIELIIDRTLYYQLKNISSSDDQINFTITLYPFNNQKDNINSKVKYLVYDCRRTSIKIQSPVTNEIFSEDKINQIHQKFVKKQSQKQLIQYTLTNQSVKKLINDQFSTIKLNRLFSINEITQLNQELSQNIILSLKFQSNFFNEQEQIIYHLQGYQFNPKGKVTTGWNIIKNGKVSKSFLNQQNEKVKKQSKENKVYSKNQLNKILELIKWTVKIQGSKIEQDSSLMEELKVLGENYYHSTKYLTYSNSILPILTYQIDCMCSATPTDQHKNKISDEKKAIRSNNKERFINICLNLAEDIKKCEEMVKEKIESIFQEYNDIHNKSNKKQQRATTLFKTNSLLLPNIPTKLSNPHFFLKPLQLKQSFTQYFIKGIYEYYHYGDHSFNDQGWGCAYRSLQTVLSWFRLNTNSLPLLYVPTIPQIQNIIDLIDYTSSTKLTSSCNWIGATQVSWVIKKLTDHNCMIQHVKDGKDILQNIQVFRHHLQNIGTPIMYGGDEYAYTIVGMTYSYKLGEVIFLILDPHYNGGDKIEKIIQKKGIIWRKPEEMFKKGVFYNFCLPLL